MRVRYGYCLDTAFEIELPLFYPGEMSKPLPLPNNSDDVAAADRVSWCHPDLGDGARRLCSDVVLHLHRLEYADRVAGLNTHRYNRGLGKSVRDFFERPGVLPGPAGFSPSLAALDSAVRINNIGSIQGSGVGWSRVESRPALQRLLSPLRAR